MTEEQRPTFDFDNDVSIDLDDLHMEWARQAQKRKKYADEVAHLDRVIKRQKKVIENKNAKLKEATGKLILQIKDLNPKMTVQQVDATIAGHKQIEPEVNDLSDAQDQLIDMEYDLNMAKNALKAMDDKKDAIEGEVSLWKGNYFATPREHRDVDAGKIMVKEIQNKTVEKQRESLNATKPGRRQRKK